jgi:tRNA (pseudouridine54-N1)-methyltransferase
MIWRLQVTQKLTGGTLTQPRRKSKTIRVRAGSREPALPKSSPSACVYVLWRIVRRFVVIGQQAGASNDFSLDDLPGSSGRLDVLLRCVRAALLVSHGVRRDVVVYLVFLGGPQPRVLRFDGAAARFVRPDERSLATLVKKALAKADDLQRTARGFVEVKAGIASASGGLAEVIADLGCATPFVLDENGADVRDSKDLGRGDVAFFVGDHKGFGEATRTSLAAIGARPIRVGPVSLHAEDAIAVVSNEIDRGAPVQASV